MQINSTEKKMGGLDSVMPKFRFCEIISQYYFTEPESNISVYI